MDFWYKQNFSALVIAWLLLPFSALFWLIAQIRLLLFKKNILSSYHSPVPVIVVGNISVGGNGKTPVVIWLVQQLQKQHFKVGVISRGYGSQSGYYPRLVSSKDEPIQCGDEPVLIAKRTNVPVCISASRKEAIELLLKEYACDVIISDDGLQHYKLQRDFEIIVIDADRGIGNGFVMPSGPLRELPHRLKSVDLILSNGKATEYSNNVITLVPKYAINLVTAEQRLMFAFSGEIANAIAGIGNPQRFFTMLQELGIKLDTTQALQDHQKFNADLLSKFNKKQPLFMTEKDAVKCGQFAEDNWWYIPVEAEITGKDVPIFIDKVVQGLKNE
ncbi:lipid-A-disaccharide kinase [Bisgaardia hudsonensis]|uniref:Tetraacyldisaccharide 4'-kinase n=1 Tax=Bisgaardia hudsonensis TaxID=109472 RepID=A0A4R2N028_9PAST|nr:tetraacyldisaccharide 4'-kinase [Bisgaardia hudsonensis]QLB13321.1 tetraacyldisaccharide 4'-kinase [Bisgaardia hudsonensis]TCP12721.1 lipid-A-disaccharide kinase [Bisgaardia hudsonensis]